MVLCVASAGKIGLGLGLGLGLGVNDGGVQRVQVK